MAPLRGMSVPAVDQRIPEDGAASPREHLCPSTPGPSRSCLAVRNSASPSAANGSTAIRTDGFCAESMDVVALLIGDGERGDVLSA